MQEAVSIAEKIAPSSEQPYPTTSVTFFGEVSPGRTSLRSTVFPGLPEKGGVSHVED